MNSYVNEWVEATRNSDVIVADGFGVSITVKSGHLVISDGIAGERRERKIPRVPRTVNRLVIFGATGQISLDAITWLAECEIPWSMVDRNGKILASSGPTRNDARLIRSQAGSIPGGDTEAAGLAIVQKLLSAKISGQARVLRDILRAHQPAALLDKLATNAGQAESVDMCRACEGEAAAAYWQAMSGKVYVPFHPAALNSLPVHWLEFSGRPNVTDGINRHANTPINACLNYLYKIAESEAQHACHIMGLNPSLGMLHMPKATRDSLALDLIEPIRPLCDELILALMDTGTGPPMGANGKPQYLSRKWFDEMPDGVCRLVPPLTHKLAAYSERIATAILPHVQETARILALAADGEVKLRVIKRAKNKAVPVSSSKQSRLKDGVSVSHLIPDSLWRKIDAMIPPPPAGPGKRGRPRDTAQDRNVIAALAASEILSVPWSSIPVDVSKQLCRVRKMEWTWTRTADGLPVWDVIAGEIQRHGHLRDLAQIP